MGSQPTRSPLTAETHTGYNAGQLQGLGGWTRSAPPLVTLPRLYHNEEATEEATNTPEALASDPNLALQKHLMNGSNLRRVRGKKECYVSKTMTRGLRGSSSPERRLVFSEMLPQEAA